MHGKSLSLSFALLVFVLGPNLLGQQIVIDQDASPAQLDQLPLVFEPNRGQAAADVHFLSRGSAYTLFLGSDKAVLMLPPAAVGGGVGKIEGRPSIVTLALLGASRQAQLEGLDLLPGKSNYFTGKDPAKWMKRVPQYAKVSQKSIYSGIDLMYYGKDGHLEYDFVLSPGADPRALRFRVSGATKVDLGVTGNLSLQTTNGTIELQKPTIYQEFAGARHMVEGSFVLHKGDEVGINVGDYDRGKSLVIDPMLSYSTLIGANNSTQVEGIAADPSGNVYITGTTFATNYPTVKAFQPTNHGYTDIFVTKLNPAGNVILYSTYLGGSAFDNAAAIAVDNSGNAYVTGTVGSSDFPTSPGAFMTACPGICNTPFVTKILADGSLGFSTFMGGSNSPAHAIAVDGAEEVYIAGDTASNDLPTTPGSFEPVYPGLQCTSCYNGYVEKLNSSGTGLVYSTYFGTAVGPAGIPSTLGSGIAVDAAGSAYLVGSTTGIPVHNPIQYSPTGGPSPFVTKFSPDGSSLLFSTYLGGSGGDYAKGVAVDALGNIHVVGTSTACDFPLSLKALSTDCATTQYSQKIFVAELNSTGSQLLFSTFLQSGLSSGIAVDEAGNSYVTGITTSVSLPTLNPIEVSSQRAPSIGFVTELDPSGKLLFSTYLGATSGGSQPAGIALDGKGGIYIAGAGQGDFPLLHPIPSQIIQNTYNTLFVSKVVLKNAPQFSLSPRVSPVLALRNVSSLPLAISAITHSSNFTEGGTCGSSLTLAPGTGCTLILEGAADKKTSGSVTITSNAYAKPQQLVISKSPTGDSVGSILTIFPTYMQFPSQLIGTTSAAQRIVIENSGLLPAAINGIQMIQPSAFTETNDCPAMLNAASSCTISVRYTAATVQDSAQLAIVTDPNQTRYTAFLSGVGSTSAIALSTSSVQFGTQFVGGPSLGRIVNLTNTTPYPASVTRIFTSTGFAQVNTCAAVLAPQSSCRVSVTYAPSTNQDSIGTLTAANFGPGGAQSVNLYGTGLIQSSLSVSPMPLSLFALVNQTPASGVITLTNISKSPLNILGFQVAGPFSQTNNCAKSLAAGASCALTVTFKPTQGGTYNGTVSILNSGPNSPQAAPINGTAQTVLSITPTLVDFGQQKLHLTSPGYFGLGNGVGYQTVTVSSITVSGADFSLPKSSCPLVYPPFVGCEWQVNFTPSQTGLRTATLKIVANDSPSPHVALLRGIGVSNGQGTLSATSLDFGTESVGHQSPVHQVALTNTGTGALKLSGIAASRQFFSQTNTCGSSLAAGAKCTISIRFIPTLQGMLVGSLSVQDDGAGSPHAVALSGIGQ